MLNFCDFIQVFVFTRNHHLNSGEKYIFIDNQQPKQIDFRETTRDKDLFI